MASNTFPLFNHLPAELRSQIWLESMPSTVTIHIRDGADLDVTSISSPPAHPFTTKEARQAYLSKGYKAFSIYTIYDWQDIHANKDTTIQLIIEPSKSPKANLNITWTELQVVLHDALPLVKKLHIACSDLSRLVRLWMLPEGGLVRVGQTHFDEDLFGKEGVASDREYRDTVPLEELRGEDMKTWELGVEKVLEGFGRSARISTTRAFRSVGGEEEEGEEEEGVEEWEEFRGEVGKALTEKALEKFVFETGWKPRSATPSSEYSEDVYYDGELWLTAS
ncbi:hypothetical protein GQ44DRAFT_633655 [Phaeosphaeriaceae sp. PMI808]|nr:hypothetical protein GQ44DRAFT_633655 [Phaeosphaeriaceae sp. PMI808]